jgi:ParB-like nuclease domain
MSAVSTIHVGPYQLMPDMTPEAFAALKADIASRGVVTPIDVDETGAILDGHHRYRAWAELQRNELPPVIVRAGLSEAEKQSFAIRQNVHRRHLTRAQMQDLIERELKGRPDHSNRSIAADLGVDHKTIGRLRKALNATGEVPQLDATVGADGKARRAKASDETLMFAKIFGGKVGVGGLPDDMKRAILKAGIPANSVVVMPESAGRLFPDPADLLSPEQTKDWDLFGQLLETKLGWSKEHIGDHFNWVIAHKGFASPDEWLGEEAAKFRKRCGMPEPSDEFKGWWRELKAAEPSP